MEQSCCQRRIEGGNPVVSAGLTGGQSCARIIRIIRIIRSEASIRPRHLPACRACATRGRNSDFALHRGRNSDFALPPRSDFRLRYFARKTCHQSCVGHRIAPLNPALGTGLPHSILRWAQNCPPSILRWAQDCPTQSCAGDEGGATTTYYGFDEDEWDVKASYYILNLKDKAVFRNGYRFIKELLLQRDLAGWRGSDARQECGAARLKTKRKKAAGPSEKKTPQARFGDTKANFNG